MSWHEHLNWTPIFHLKYFFITLSYFLNPKHSKMGVIQTMAPLFIILFWLHRFELLCQRRFLGNQSVSSIPPRGIVNVSHYYVKYNKESQDTFECQILYSALKLKHSQSYMGAATVVKLTRVSLVLSWRNPFDTPFPAYEPKFLRNFLLFRRRLVFP